MVKVKLYLSIVIVLISTMIGSNILLDNHKMIEPTNISGAIAYNTENTTTTTLTTSTSKTSTITKTTTTKITTTTTQEVVPQQVANNSVNTMSISGTNKVYKLKQDDGSGKLLDGNQYGMIDHRYKDTHKKMIIYGHSNPDGTGLFQYFQNYDGNKSFFDKHKYITVNYEGIIYTYEIFSVYNQRLTSDPDTTEYYMSLYYPDAYLYNKALQSYKNKSQYDTGVTLNADCKILIIQTCSMNPNRVGRTNLLIFGKLIETKKEA